MKERRIVNLSAGMIDIKKSPYPVSNSWGGVYKQRLEFYNTKSHTIIKADLSAVEIVYWRDSLDKALGELQSRMVKDCGGAA